MMDLQFIMSHRKLYGYHFDMVRMPFMGVTYSLGGNPRDRDRLPYFTVILGLC